MDEDMRPWKADDDGPPVRTRRGGDPSPPVSVALRVLVWVAVAIGALVAVVMACFAVWIIAPAPVTVRSAAGTGGRAASLPSASPGQVRISGPSGSGAPGGASASSAPASQTPASAPARPSGPNAAPPAGPPQSPDADAPPTVPPSPPSPTPPDPGLTLAQRKALVREFDAGEEAAWAEAEKRYPTDTNVVDIKTASANAPKANECFEQLSASSEAALRAKYHVTAEQLLQIRAQAYIENWAAEGGQ